MRSSKLQYSRLHSSLAAVTLAGVATVAGAPAAHALSTSDSNYTITCDSATHALGSVTGARPGEGVTFTSPEVGGLLPGTADGSGSIRLIWTCDASEIGSTWHVTARGSASGTTTSFTVTGTDPNGTSVTHAAGATSPVGKPADEIVVTWNYDPVTPREPNDPPKGSYEFLSLTQDWHIADNDCDNFSIWGFNTAASLCRHYLERTGEDYYLDMPDLIDDERPLWASFEHSIRWEVNDLMDEVRAVPTDSSQTFTFTSGWRGYSISPTAGDWWGALAHINWAARGDIWVGPMDANGDRPIQIRYRPFVSDMYDFEESQYPSEYRLAERGWANPFHVKGVGNQRTFEYSLSTLDPWSIPFTP